MEQHRALGSRHRPAPCRRSDGLTRRPGGTQVHRSGEGRRPRRALLRVRSVDSNQPTEGGAVRYEIDLDALVDFVRNQVEKIEAAAVAEQYNGLVALPVPGESTSADELRVLW